MTVKKFFTLLGKGLLGLIALLLGAVFMTIVLVVRIVSFLAERILYYPYLVVKGITVGSQDILRRFVYGYKTAAQKKREAMKGVVIAGMMPGQTRRKQ